MASLYRKYRPRTFSELVGQSTVVTALSNAITTGQTVHAYLMTGPRGSGKTSSARLLAKAVNCTRRQTSGRKGADPCNACEICQAADEGRLLDLIEIDAASNRGIDNMRDIRAQVAYAPSTAKHKVYIIDEAHMLSKEASNAFLKTLEEPPPFVMFILATTEVHKILPTIVSRCQRYDFRKLDFVSASERLRDVAAQEGIAVDAEALAFIVGRGDGALRDMLGLLEQVASYVPRGETLTRELCLAALGMIGDEAVFDLLDAAEAGAAGQVVSLLAQFSRQGVDAAVLTGQLTEHARRLLWLSSGNEALVADASPAWLARAKEQAARLGVSGTIALLERLSAANTELRTATLPYFVLELALLRTAGAGDLASRIAQLEHRLEQIGSGGAIAPGAAAAPRPVVPQTTPAPAAAAPAAAPEPPPAAAAPAPAKASRSKKAAATAATATPPPAPAATPAAPPAPPAPAPVEAAPPSPAPPESPPPESLAGAAVPIVLPDEPEFDETDSGEGPAVAAAPDDLKAAWERVMTRIRTDSPRLHGILREVLAFQKTAKTLKLFVRKGHSFAMDTLRKEPPALMTVLEQELGAKLSLAVVEDPSAPGLSAALAPEGGGPGEVTPAPQASSPERDRGWIEKKAVKSKAVQSVVAGLDGEIIRVD